MSVSMRKHKNIKVMRIVQSSFFRALCAVIIGALLIKYREQTVTWMTIVIGVMFFLSGVVSCAGKRIRDAAFFFIIMLVTFAATLLNPQKYVSSRTIQKCVEHVSTST